MSAVFRILVKYIGGLLVDQDSIFVDVFTPPGVAIQLCDSHLLGSFLPCVFST
jgi:hypothetical protein